MSKEEKKLGPITRLWNATLMLLGVVLVLWFILQVLSAIWLWLLLIGAVVAIAAVAIRWWLQHRGRL